MNILHIDCSPRAASHSRQLSAAIVARLLAAHPDARITRRDLGGDPIPHAESDYATALASRETLAIGIANGATRLSEQLILEIEDADVLVMGTPMNNFTVPSVLKAWIDQIVRIGRSFAPAPTGEKIGLLPDRPVYIAIASGGLFTGDNAKQPDFLTPYLSAALGCVGLNSVQFLSLQGTAFRTPEQLAADQEALLTALHLA
ncbi:FMN-dependent NADH-azoreductase [Bordetella muralis]|jgi:FMN-dependent NADH-azoreductase|uniref:FMN-dependent NADH-azoreductase n=1 Tax=Bordetella muralis TaxID=1649130 RepID=UPI0039F0047D